MRFLVDESMPRALAGAIRELGFTADDVRELGLANRPDSEVLAAAAARDAIIITRDREFADECRWPPDHTAGVVLIAPGAAGRRPALIARVVRLVSTRLPESLLGAVTVVEPHRALSQIVRRRP
jgi:predicted nuclease of predicted toxin-antitoxin system